MATFIVRLPFFSEIGFMMAACILVGVFAGKYLDQLFGTSPFLLLFFSFLGGAAAFKAIYDMSKK